MSKIFKNALLIFFSILTTITVRGQDAPNLNSAQTSVENSNSNVVTNDLYSGTANVSVPFYSANFDGLNIGVNISYNTSGIRVDQLSTTVGLGWDLSTGGSITRTVKGEPDESYVQEFTFTDPYDPTNQTIYVSNPIEYGSWFNQGVDSELDEFQLNIASRNLKFYISRSGNVVTVPQSNITIQRIIQGVTIGNTTLSPADPTQELDLQFLVTDESGNKFLFQKGDYQTISYDTVVYFENPDEDDVAFPVTTYANHSQADNWVLKQITTYNGSQINYDYTNSYVNYKQYKNQSVTLSNVGYGMVGGNIVYNIINCNESNTYWSGNLCFISKISFPNNVFVSFDYKDIRCDMPGSKVLSDIVVSDNSNSQQGNFYKYIFNQDYWLSAPLSNSSNLPSYTYSIPETPLTSLQSDCYSMNSNTIDTTQYRLMLNSISEEDKNQNSLPYFSFGYYSSTRLPARFCTAQDYCGFSNGKIGNPVPYNGQNYYFNIPLFTNGAKNSSNQLINYGIDKTSDIQWAQAGVLNSIINGLGGETDLFYEAHNNLSSPINISSSSSSGQHISRTPSYPYSIASFARGIRLSHVIYKDGFNDDNTRSVYYNYQNGEAFLSAAESILETYSTCSNPYPDEPFTTYFNTNLCANPNVNGSNQGYANVDEIKKDKNGAILSKTSYTFSNAINNNLGGNILSPSNTNNDPSFFQPFYSEPFSEKQYYREWGMGLPIETDYYDNNYVLLKKQSIVYNVTTAFSTSMEFRNIHSLGKTFDCNDNPSVSYIDYYYPASGIALPSSEIETSYLANNHTSSKTKSFTYDSYNNLKTVTGQLSGGDILQTINYYNYDWKNFPTSSAIDLMNNNKWQKLLLSEVWKNTNGTNRLISVNPRVFDLYNNYIVPSSKYLLIPAAGLSSYISGPTSFNMKDAVLGNPISNYRLTDKITAYADPRWIGETHHVMNGEEYSSNLYDNNTDRVIAEVDHAKLSEIAYTSFEGLTYNSSGNPDVNKGNWDFDPNAIIDPNTVSLGSYGVLGSLGGKKVFKLDPSGSTGTQIVSTINPTSGKKYVLNFWTYGGHAPIVNQGGNPLTMLNPGFAKNGWMQNYLEFYSNGGQVTISVGSGIIYLDELRLYPYGARMKTFNYDILNGVSDVCDEVNRFTFYEYDGFGRQNIVRNNLGEILSKTQYSQQGNQ